MGLKLKPKNLGIFEKKMLELIEKEYDEEKWGKKLVIDAEIKPEEIDWDLFSEIKKFEPFGMGNREPVFLSNNLTIREIKLVGNGQKHIKFIFEAGKSKIIEGIFWRGGEKFPDFKPGDKLSAAFLLRSNEWNGSRKLELNIIDIQKS
jgi:single-stranded-DNA-specific exonuclease